MHFLWLILLVIFFSDIVGDIVGDIDLVILFSDIVGDIF